MRKPLHSFCSYLLLCLLALSPIAGQAADAPGKQQQSQDGAAAAPVKVNATAELTKLQKQLDSIKQQVSGSNNDNKLSGLNDAALELAADADALVTALIPDRAQLQSQLEVLGPAPAPDQNAMAETSQVTRQRATLNVQKGKLDDQIKQAQAIKDNAANLSAQIVALRRNALRTQLALNSGSILGGRFWSPLVDKQSEDARRFETFGQQISQAWEGAWQPDWRYGSIVCLLLAVAIGTYGRHLLERGLAWVGINLLPEGRLRRSFLASATALASILTIGIAANLVAYTFTRHTELSDSVLTFVDNMVKLAVFSALISGLGRAFLSNQRPSWRLATIADPVARGMKSFPPLLAGLIFIFGIIEQTNNAVGTSVPTTIMGNGLASLLVAITAAMIPIRSNRIRNKLAAEGEALPIRSPVDALIHLAISITAIAILISLLIGYIALARFLTYELVWVAIVLSCIYFLIHLVVDACESVFSASSFTGQRIKRSLNLDDRHLAQAAALLSAIGKTMLLLFAVVALLNGTFGTTTPLVLLQNAIEIYGGKGLEKLNIVPAHVLNALILAGVGIYVLRSARRWLDKDFLPKTMMEPGLRSSLVTLFSNVGYVLIILLALTTLGIRWNNLAWIVSALSVGIGFGLQEIVKNFISGLILLTERPVKVGDLISISGIEGDIRRINVRATEIQLGDRSTVIVPNSQLISQNVRNATMGNAQGVATIALTFPLDIDPEQVRTLLLDVYRENEAILDSPAPSVTFSQLSSTGIVLSVTGFVSSPRVVGNAKSDLLFEILKHLRAAGIALSAPQKMILENAPAPVPENPVA